MQSLLRSTTLLSAKEAKREKVINACINFCKDENEMNEINKIKTKLLINSAKRERKNIGN